MHKWSVQNRANRVRKTDFLGIVQETWDESFSPELIKTAFKKCGKYPLDRTKYPTEAFAPSKYAVYKLNQARQAQVSSLPLNEFLNYS